jgi:hypothetical protein
MMYGRDLAFYDTAETVLGYAREAILASLSAASEYGVVRLIVDDELTKRVGLEFGYGNVYASGIGIDSDSGEGGNEDGDNFSPGARAGLTISTLALIASLVGFFVYVRLDTKAGNSTRRTRAERFVHKLDGRPFFARLLAHAGSSDNRGRAKIDHNGYSDEVEPSLHIQIEDGKPVLTHVEPSISDSTVNSAVNSVTGSSRSDDSIEHSCLMVEEPNDVDSFLNEPNDVDSFFGSLSESVILPEDDAADEMYLDAFR